MAEPDSKLCDLQKKHFISMKFSFFFICGNGGNDDYLRVLLTSKKKKRSLSTMTGT